MMRRPWDSFFADKWFDGFFSDDYFTPRPKHRSKKESKTQHIGREHDKEVNNMVHRMDDEGGNEGAIMTQAETPMATKSAEVGATDKKTDSTSLDVGRKAEDEFGLSPFSPNFGNQLFRSMFKDDFLFAKDEQNFKVDETEDSLKVSSTWDGFNKADLKVDVENGALRSLGRAKSSTATIRPAQCRDLSGRFRVLFRFPRTLTKK